MTDDTPDSEEESEESTTRSTRTRWDYTGTVLAIVVVISLPLVLFLAGLGIVSLSEISKAWLAIYGTVVLMAATWTFGKETLEAVRKARGK